MPVYPSPPRGERDTGGGDGEVTDPIESALAEIKFGADGLVPAIAQQHDTGEILMMAWMNRDAVRASLTEGRACYWSRSRARLWRKWRNLRTGPAPARAAPRLRRRCRARCWSISRVWPATPGGAAASSGRGVNGVWAVIAEPSISPGSSLSRKHRLKADA